MAFINILEIVYPVGSVYISTANVSPAENIGGTWTPIQGAVLGFTGANNFADSTNYGGNLKILVEQIPSHTHTVVVSDVVGSQFENYSVGLVYKQGDNRLSNQGLAYETGGGAGLSALPFLSLWVVSNRLSEVV